MKSIKNKNSVIGSGDSSVGKLTDGTNYDGESCELATLSDNNGLQSDSLNSDFVVDIDDDLSNLEKEYKEDYNIENNGGSFVDLSDSEIVRKYIQQVSKFPILTQKEEEKLLNDYIDNKNQKAGQMIILSHLRLVVKIALKYRRYGINIMDIIAEGNTGLMKALQKFDRSKHTRFSTYAVLWVRACIQEFILKSWSMVKVGSVALRKQILFNLGNIKKLLHIDNTTDKETQTIKLASHFGVSKQEIDDVSTALRQRDYTLDAPASDRNENITIIDTISGGNGNFDELLADNEDKHYRMKIFNESLSILDERQRDIIISRYLSEKKATFDDLSKKYNISKERVRQIEEAGIKKLKYFAENYDKN